ncbi:hypothetical protein K504DRAFT_468400 [Pleomassaria siparia CBS 279.74]|uniref:Uncharacterized protein n=1 Tax=Pleomassaria siparia CBS 279.74 TaxID=1314801 RepID=A0A6G1K5H4_9PLEO|nr:hypothetical protein K504DRAFT_468400 [Pleomassaria siparia CBS 279.74]
MAFPLPHPPTNAQPPPVWPFQSVYGNPLPNQFTFTPTTGFSSLTIFQQNPPQQSEGVNMTGANHVIVVDTHPRSDKVKQFKARPNRFGQRETTIYVKRYYNSRSPSRQPHHAGPGLQNAPEQHSLSDDAR